MKPQHLRQYIQMFNIEEDLRDVFTWKKLTSQDLPTFYKSVTKILHGEAIYKNHFSQIVDYRKEYEND